MFFDISLMTVIGFDSVEADLEENNVIKWVAATKDIAREKIAISLRREVTQKSIEVLKEAGIRVVPYPLEYSVEDPEFLIKIKNFGLDHCTYDWICSPDIDEEISKELKAEILLFVRQKEFDGLMMQRVNFFKQAPTQYDCVIRLFNKTAGYRYYLIPNLPPPHEAPALSDKGNGGKLKITYNSLYHWGWLFITKEGWEYKKRLNKNAIPKILGKQFSTI